MRVTGGKFRGIPIKAPGGKRTRPTSDKVREALFSTLGDRVSGARVLDLFSGSGALAIEALSRGADSAVLIEKDSAAIAVVRQNLEKTGLKKKAKVLRADFRSALAKLSRDGERFEIIFIDPPYEGNMLEESFSALEKQCVTTDESIVVVEHFAKTAPPESISGIPLDRTRAYGQTSLSYYLHGESPDRD